MSYKLLTYSIGKSAAGKAEARAGIEVGGMVYDAARVTGVASWSTVSAMLGDWRKAKTALAAAAGRIASGQSRAKGTPLARTRLLAPLPVPGAIFCAGANYTDHMLEMARVQNLQPEPDPKTQGRKPWHFIKTARSSVVGPGATVKIPAHSKMLDWEIELAAVIGTAAKNLPPEKALSCVAGYTIANDLSARDHVKREGMPETSPFKWDWISQKCFDGACPLGPWIVPASDIRDPQNLALKLWVGDELMQDSHTSRMTFSLAEQIAFLSSRLTLRPGDLVLTGTPAGVGMARRRFLQPGETVRLWIENIGEMSNRIA